MEENKNSGDLSMYESLLDDVEMDNVSLDHNGNPNYENFDDFQNSSKATQLVKDDGGYKELDSSILDDEPEEKEVKTEDYALIEDVLKSRGFDPDSIKFKNEDGEIEEFKFSELSKEDQMALLDSEEEIEDEGYSDNELEAIQFLRDNNMSISELAQQVRQNTIDELNNQERTYSVDEFTDDELFIADVRNRYGEEFTDEELLLELEKEKEHPELFEKKINKLRTDYKEYEDLEKAQTEKEARDKEQEEYNNYVSNMVEIATEMNDMHETAELEDDDKKEILDFIFNEDAYGKTELQKAYEDPKTLFKMAWYLKHGDEVFKEVHKYYQGEIKKLSKGSKVKPVEAVVNKKQNQHTTQQRPKRIEDLY